MPKVLDVGPRSVSSISIHFPNNPLIHFVATFVFFGDLLVLPRNTDGLPLKMSVTQMQLAYFIGQFSFTHLARRSGR